uniref:Uncharacterized protein n=1 Tax=Triticum urartu TaxID=4572 RepID=A0A8R7U7E1_TRIUA
MQVLPWALILISSSDPVRELGYHGWPRVFFDQDVDQVLNGCAYKTQGILLAALIMRHYDLELEGSIHA